MARQKYTYAQQQCIRSAGKLSQQTEMLSSGARVGVAVSGGMDSWVLIKALKIRQGIVPFSFSLMALHVNPGFAPESHLPMTRWLEEEGIASHIDVTDHGLRAHSEENRKDSACFYCAMLRRKRLFELCRDYRLTHLAFGHNADDLVSTFFMNLFQNGRVEGMSMREPFFGGSLMVIRPLMLLEKSVISKAAKAWDFPVWSNPCPSAGRTRRSSVMEDLDAVWKNAKGSRTKTVNGLVRWQLKRHIARLSEEREGEAPSPLDTL